MFNRFKSKNFQKPDIYVYWDSGFEGMKPLIKSIYLNNKKVAEKYNYNYILVTKKNVRQYIDVPDKFFLLKSNFQSDICRYFLLSKYGGVWMDCDILLYRNMDSLIKKKKNKEMLIIEEYKNKIGCAFIIAEKNTPSINYCKQYVVNILKNTPIEKFYWEIIGPNTIEKCYKLFKKNMLLLTGKHKAHNSINYFDWRAKTDENLELWYKENKEQAKKTANKIKKYNYPIIITWQLYKSKKYDPIVLNDMVVKDEKSIFYYFFN